MAVLLGYIACMSTATPNRTLLSVPALAEYLGVQPTTIYHWRVRGEGPPAVLVGRRVRFRHEDVESWLEDRRTPPSEKDEGSADTEPLATAIPANGAREDATSG